MTPQQTDIIKRLIRASKLGRSWIEGFGRNLNAANKLIADRDADIISQAIIDGLKLEIKLTKKKDRVKLSHPLYRTWAAHREDIPKKKP